MKRKFSIVLVAVLFIGLTSQAQIQRGNILVGGDIANFDLNLNGGGYFSMRLDPKLAFFVRDNVAVGAFIDLGVQTARNAGTNVNYGIGALGRYYVNNPKVNVLRHGRFFFEGTIGIEGDNPANGETTNGLGLGIGPGYAYFITPNIGLETLLKYNGIVGFGNQTTSSDLNLGVGFQIYLPTRRLREAATNP